MRLWSWMPLSSVVGFLYGVGMYYIISVGLFLLKEKPLESNFFVSCRYFISPQIATSLLLLAPMSLRWDLIKDRIVNQEQFEWKVGVFTLLQAGFIYSNAIVFPTELVCSLYEQSFEYTFYNILLASPSMIILVAFCESFGIHGRFYEYYLNELQN